MFHLDKIQNLQMQQDLDRKNFWDLCNEVDKLRSIIFSLVEVIPSVPVRYVLKKK